VERSSQHRSESGERRRLVTFRKRENGGGKKNAEATAGTPINWAPVEQAGAPVKETGVKGNASRRRGKEKRGVGTRRRKSTPGPGLEFGISKESGIRGSESMKEGRGEYAGKKMHSVRNRMRDGLGG